MLSSRPSCRMAAAAQVAGEGTAREAVLQTGRRPYDRWDPIDTSAGTCMRFIDIKHTGCWSGNRCGTHLMPGILVATDPAHKFCTRTPNCAYSAFTESDRLSRNFLLAPYAVIVGRGNPESSVTLVMRDATRALPVLSWLRLASKQPVHGRHAHQCLGHLTGHQRGIKISNDAPNVDD